MKIVSPKVKAVVLAASLAVSGLAVAAAVSSGSASMAIKKPSPDLKSYGPTALQSYGPTALKSYGPNDLKWVI